MKASSNFLKDRLLGFGEEILGDLPGLFSEIDSFGFDSKNLKTRFVTIQEKFELTDEELDLLILGFVDRILGGRLLGPMRRIEDLCQIRPGSSLLLGPKTRLGALFTEQIALRDSLFYYLTERAFVVEGLTALNETPLLNLEESLLTKIRNLALQRKRIAIISEDFVLIKSLLASKAIFEIRSSAADPQELFVFKTIHDAILLAKPSNQIMEGSSALADISVLSSTEWQAQKTQADQLVFTEAEFPFISKASLWERELASCSVQVSKTDLQKIQAIFPYRLTQIRQVVEEMRAEGRDIWEFESIARICRKQNSVQLENYARKIQTQYSWEDLVLPPSSLLRLKEAERFILTKGQRKAIGQRHSRGRGVSLVFEGPSGTGKTMAAEVLAKSLGLDLYQVNLARLTSQYIGETEKNLSEIFRAAQASAGILFFDEGESLFAKRSQGASVQDKYSNLEVNHLLQELESFEGIVIISTNLGDNIDSAFLRRINFELRFPRPNAKAREKIWKLHLQKDCGEVGDIELSFLSELPLTGGFIKNIVSQASSAALFEDRAVEMKDLLHAVKREYQKVKMPIQREQFGDQYWKIVSPDWDESYARRRLKEWEA
jgi:hypothetical protein